MKKILFSIMVALIALAGCSSDSKSEETTLTVWTWDENYNVPAIEKAAEIYNRDNPDKQVTLNVVAAPLDDTIQKLQVNLSSGNTSNLPDIVMLEDKNAVQTLSAYNDSFYEMTNAVNYSDFAEFKVEAGSVDGKNYNVPFDNGVAAMFYRTDLWEQAGYKSEDLQDITWKQYIDMGKVVEEKTGAKVFPSQLIDESGLLEIMMQSSGSWYVDEKGDLSIENNPELIEAVNTLLYAKENNANLPTTDWAEWVGSMNTGKVSSVTTGSWIIPSIMQAEDQSGKWGVAPVPKMENENATHYSSLGGSSWYVLNTDNSEASADFLANTFGGSSELYDALLLDINAISTYKPSLDSDVYGEASEFFGGQQIYKDLVGYSTEIPSINYGNQYTEYKAAINQYLPAVIEGKATAEEFTQSIHKELSK